MDAGGKRCLPAWMSEKGAHKELGDQSGSGGSRQLPLIHAQDPSKEASERKAASNPSSLMRAQSGCGEEVKQAAASHSSWPMNEVKLESSFPIPTSEDDVGLTVEDLVSIAEEYVNADKGKQRQHEANYYKSEAQDPRLSVLSRHPLGASHGAARSSSQITKCTTVARSSCSIATDMVEDAPHSSISRTGDVAQDMLDVLLGPLLRIPSDGRPHERGREEEDNMIASRGGNV